MIILGVDPGTINCGYAVLEFPQGKTAQRLVSGAISLRLFDNIPDKLFKIFTELSRIITEFHPRQLSIETAFYGKNVQSALKIGLARGAAILAAKQSGLDIAEYAPREIKKAVTGNGSASKEQVQYMVQTILNCKSTKFLADEADAIAAALCHSFRSKSSDKKSSNWSDYVNNFPERVIK